jgi:lysophospholipid acyltransferase (LPLAT)-like uncharacterized protein
MNERPQPSAPQVPARESAGQKIAAFLIATLVRLWFRTLRVDWHDESGGLASHPPETGSIWAFWHNRIFCVPSVYLKVTRGGTPGAVLTSASRDGAQLAAVMARFGFDAVRGSSSKRAAQALVECRRRLRQGVVLGITPDGPRGPRYELAPGVVQLARVAGVPIIPLHITAPRRWELRSWDRFQIPRPFSRITVTLGPPFFPGDDIEAARQELAGIMQEHTHD